MVGNVRSNPLWDTTWINLNEAYDPLIFPERFALAEKNAQNVLSGVYGPFQAHLLDRFLPLNEDNPRNPCNKRYQRCMVTYSRRCRCQCQCEDYYGCKPRSSCC